MQPRGSCLILGFVIEVVLVEIHYIDPTLFVLQLDETEGRVAYEERNPIPLEQLYVPQHDTNLNSDLSDLLNTDEPSRVPELELVGLLISPKQLCNEVLSASNSYDAEFIDLDIAFLKKVCQLFNLQTQWAGFL